VTAEKTVSRVRFGSARRALLASVAALAAGGMAKLSAPQVAEAADPNDLVVNATTNASTTTTLRKNVGSSVPALVVTNNTGIGIIGSTTDSYGVFGVSTSGNGVIGQCDGANEGVLGISATGVGLRGQSSASIGLFGSTATGFGGFFQATGAGGVALRAAGSVIVTGDFSATGMKSALVAGTDGDLRRVFCLESPDSMFEDFGRDKIVNGRGTVRLDPEFRAIIRGDEYEIFLTPLGECNGLYVSNMNRGGFEVKELGSGTSSVAFSYRVAGKRKDVGDDKRLERVKVKDMGIKPRDGKTLEDEIRARRPK
jgi:hypothetical protein